VSSDDEDEDELGREDDDEEEDEEEEDDGSLLVREGKEEAEKEDDNGLAREEATLGLKADAVEEDEETDEELELDAALSRTTTSSSSSLSTITAGSSAVAPASPGGFALRLLWPRVANASRCMSSLLIRSRLRRSACDNVRILYEKISEGISIYDYGDNRPHESRSCELQIPIRCPTARTCPCRDG